MHKTLHLPASVVWSVQRYSPASAVTSDWRLVSPQLVQIVLRHQIKTSSTIRNMSFKYYTEIRGTAMHKKGFTITVVTSFLLISINDLQISPVEQWNFSYWTSSRDGKQTTTRNQWALKIMEEINGDMEPDHAAGEHSLLSLICAQSCC